MPQLLLSFRPTAHASRRYRRLVDDSFVLAEITGSIMQPAQKAVVFREQRPTPIDINVYLNYFIRSKSAFFLFETLHL